MRFDDEGAIHSMLSFSEVVTTLFPPQPPGSYIEVLPDINDGGIICFMETKFGLLKKGTDWK
jgi:hypothetical protein